MVFPRRSNWENTCSIQCHCCKLLILFCPSRSPQIVDMHCIYLKFNLYIWRSQKKKNLVIVDVMGKTLEQTNGKHCIKMSYVNEYNSINYARYSIVNIHFVEINVQLLLKITPTSFFNINIFFNHYNFLFPKKKKNIITSLAISLTLHWFLMLELFIHTEDIHIGWKIISNFKHQSKLSLCNVYYILIISNIAINILFVLGLI